MAFATLRCAVSGHDLLVRDHEQGTPVWRCPRCWHTQARERVADPRPVRPLDARFIYNPVENQVLRRSAITALSAAERWRVRASRVAQGASSAA
jgi:hypothetical protein